MTEKWESIEELMSALDEVHKTEVTVYGKCLEIAWAELDADEHPNFMNPRINKMSEDEQMEWFKEMQEYMTWKMIEKGQKKAEEMGDPPEHKLSEDQFYALKQRVKDAIVTAINGQSSQINENL